MKSASSRSPVQTIPSVQTPPFRTTGPFTSVKVGREDVAFRDWAKCTVHVPLSVWLSPVDSSQAKSTIPPAPPTIVGKTTAPLPALILCIADHVRPLSVEDA